ncbi:MAG: ribosome biogenesis GTP-binding protein YihA/YsxC [Pseudomonadota bacterium]|nr:ribosome biogenesis GTP-binding protein YihA/YsxC [Pseudomonadota bacterium]
MPILLNPNFIKSAHEPHQFPDDVGREVAVVGRSNSGKSTAINAIVRRRNLARTSKTPGRTQLINFFDLGENRRLVDLPGYGYAKVAESVRQHWRSLLEAYFQQRKSLVGLIITVDIRRGLKDLDHVMMDWAEGAQVPVVVLLTKSDKLSYSARLNCLAKVKKSMPSVTPLILFSAPNKTGVEEARDLLIGWLEYKDKA